MPIYEYRCINGHLKESYEILRDKGCLTHVCGDCGCTMGQVISHTAPLLYFEEGRGRWIHNLAHDPIYITSHKQHEREMKKAGVTLAGNRPGTRGACLM